MAFASVRFFVARTDGDVVRAACREVTEQMQRKKLALQEELRQRRELAEQAAQKPSLAELRRQVRPRLEAQVKNDLRRS